MSYPKNTNYIDYPSHLPERECDECGTTDGVEPRAQNPLRAQMTCPAHQPPPKTRPLCDDCDDTPDSLEELIGDDVVAAVRYECGWFTVVDEPQPPTTEVLVRSDNGGREKTERRLPDRYADQPQCQLRCDCGARIDEIIWE